MSPLTLDTLPFLPLVKGVWDSGNPSVGLTGAVRAMKGFNIIGANKLTTRGGNAVSLTLKDDAGTPADVTSVCGVWQYLDKAVAVGHSTVTDKAYLYLLSADLTDWYDGTAGSLQGTTSPEPAVVIWSSISTAPDVFVSEGLGFLYIAHSQGIDSSALNFPTKQWDGTYPVALTNLKGSGTGGTAGTDDIYANGCIAYQDHLWIWGYGSGNTVADAYRPELARFSQPDFAALQSSDSLTLGNRVRSDREKIISGGLAGNALILQGTYITSRVTGYGRLSWFREIVDESSGIVGPKAGVSDDTYWYYWSAQGPLRIASEGKPEPLYEPLMGLVSQVVNPEKIVAARDVPNNLVVFHVDTGSGIRTRVAYHVLRNIWITTTDDVGLVIKSAGEVAPVVSSIATGVAAPSGPPTTPSTTAVGATTATANWAAGDTAASTQVEYRVQGTSTWTVATTVAPGVTSYAFSGLTLGVSYEWRAAHVRGGQYSAYLGPSADTQFTTVTTLQPPTNLAANCILSGNITASWMNSGESGVSTEIYVDSSLVQTANPGESNKTFAATNGSHDVTIRHVKSGCNPSSFVGPANVVVS